MGIWWLEKWTNLVFRWWNLAKSVRTSSAVTSFKASAISNEMEMVSFQLQYYLPNPNQI